MDGKSEVKVEKCDLVAELKFRLYHQVTLLIFEPTFQSMDPLSKRYHSDFFIHCVLRNFTKIWLHVYQESLTVSNHIIVAFKDTR